MELLVLTLLLVIVAGALIWDRHTQREYVARVQADWQDAGRSITAGPVGVICHGSRPPGITTERLLGALGVAGDHLLFTGNRSAAFDLDAPLAAIRWIGLRTHVKVSWNRRIESRVLRVHLELPGGWRVYTFADGPVEVFAQQVADACGLPVQDVGEGFEDFGPAPAVYLVHDAAGDWVPALAGSLDLTTPPPDWDGLRHTLYLAPDRLLFDWAHAIPLADVRRVSLYAQGDALNPFDHSLLRVDYTRGGTPRAAGFLLHHGGDWAGIIEQRTAIPVTRRTVNVKRGSS